MSLWLLPGIPLAGAAAVVALRGRSGRAKGTAALVALLAQLATLVAAVALVASRSGVSWSWVWCPGIEPRIALEGFGRVMAVLIPAVAAPIVAYASRSEERNDPGRLLAWMLGFTGAMELLVLAGDLLTLLVAWELVGLCSWALIGHELRDPAGPRAAAQAFLTTRFGDLGLYLAAAAAFAGAGSLDFRELGTLHGPALHVVAGGLLLAASAKSAQGPFAPWLFSAMAGPTPVSALLHSATMVAAGAYALVRLAPELEAAGWLAPAVAGVGVATVWAGGVVAALQTDLKKALAASTSSQYGLMFVAVGAGSVAAAGIHLVTHAAFKSLLFLGAGVAIHAAGSGALGRLAGQSRGRSRGRSRSGASGPGAWLFGVGILALAAVPPLGGAWSKEEVVAAAFHHAPCLGALTLASGVLTAFYALRLQLLAFGVPAGAGASRSGAGPSRRELGALAVLAGLTVLLGFLWLPGAEHLVERTVQGKLMKGAPWELVVGVAAVALGAGLAWLLGRRGRLTGGEPERGLPGRLREGAAAWLGIPALARHGIARPVLALASTLAAFDDRVVDAGVRAAARVGRSVSRLLATVSERGVDGVVRAAAGFVRSASRLLATVSERGVDRVVEALARGTVAFAAGSGRFDDGAIDGSVEGAARITGRIGTASRRLQTGAAHHYYTLIAAGTLAVMVVLLAALLGGGG